jgi:putative sigma-54 modulation protein
MEVTITARHFQLDPSLREYLEAEIAGLTRFFERILEVHVILEQEGYRQAAEIVVHLPRTHRIRAQGEGKDMRLAFDAAVEKLETQIKRYKEKFRENKRHRKEEDE